MAFLAKQNLYASSTRTDVSNLFAKEIKSRKVEGRSISCDAFLETYKNTLHTTSPFYNSKNRSFYTLTSAVKEDRTESCDVIIASISCVVINQIYISIMLGIKGKRYNGRSMNSKLIILANGNTYHVCMHLCMYVCMYI
jgi:hypothetical protein